MRSRAQIARRLASEWQQKASACLPHICSDAIGDGDGSDGGGDDDRDDDNRGDDDRDDDNRGDDNRGDDIAPMRIL